MTPIVAFSNRLPVQRTRYGWRQSDGGLVTALRPALATRRATWVGWDGGGDDLPRRVDDLAVELRSVALTRAELEGYYHGFANRTLWPLLHGGVELPVFERGWWDAYRTVNNRFALADPPRGKALRWVHDYHLLLVPGLLRARGPHGRIVVFLHVPFPAPEIFARLPWRAEILEGMLGADMLGFQTFEYRDNFLSACAQLLDQVKVSSAGIRTSDQRTVRVEAHPISIDAKDFAERAAAPAVERHLTRLRQQFSGKRVLLGVDRLDYSKGIPQRLLAYELLLELQPELRGTTAFVQVAVPSRGEIREYGELRATVERHVGRINGRFTEPGQDVPVHYLYRGVSSEDLLAYYRLADVAVVTPLRDGMNLVAKEFVTAQGANGGRGALVLSEFTGAINELPEALPCNPYDLEGLAGTLALALELEEADRRERLQRMTETVRQHDIHAWAARQLRATDARRQAR